MKRCTGRNCIMQYDKVDPATCQAVDYCPQATPPKSIADKIRCMTVEEMASFFDLHVPGYWRRDAWLKWLKQEAEDSVKIEIDKAMEEAREELYKSFGLIEGTDG